MHFTVYIAIGSNLGDRRANCLKAVEHVCRLKNTRVIKISKWYESKALTFDSSEHPNYINGAIMIETTLQPMELLSALKAIEKRMGRKPSPKKWDDRIIDLDILKYDDLEIKTTELTIPHPEMNKRDFVMKPLSDIC